MKDSHEYSAQATFSTVTPTTWVLGVSHSDEMEDKTVAEGASPAAAAFSSEKRA